MESKLHVARTKAPSVFAVGSGGGFFVKRADLSEETENWLAAVQLIAKLFL
jgi:hypothetical protein